MKHVKRLAGYGPWAIAAALALKSEPAMAQKKATAPPANRTAVVNTFGDHDLANVQIAWLSDPALFGCGLVARMTGDGMELCGIVPNEAVHQKALHVAQNVAKGNLIDHMRVHAGMAIALAQPAAPAELAPPASTRLAEALGEKVLGLRVRCPAPGRVEVAGDVSSIADKLLVSQCLRSLPGCVCVVNKVAAPSSAASAALAGDVPLLTTQVPMPAGPMVVVAPHVTARQVMAEPMPRPEMKMVFPLTELTQNQKKPIGPVLTPDSIDKPRVAPVVTRPMAPLAEQKPMETVSSGEPRMPVLPPPTMKSETKITNYLPLAKLKPEAEPGHAVVSKSEVVQPTAAPESKPIEVTKASSKVESAPAAVVESPKVLELIPPTPPKLELPKSSESSQPTIIHLPEHTPAEPVRVVDKPKPIPMPIMARLHDDPAPPMPSPVAAPKVETAAPPMIAGKASVSDMPTGELPRPVAEIKPAPMPSEMPKFPEPRPIAPPPALLLPEPIKEAAKPMDRAVSAPKFTNESAKPLIPSRAVDYVAPTKPSAPVVETVKPVTFAATTADAPKLPTPTVAEPIKSSDGTISGVIRQNGGEHAPTLDPETTRKAIEDVCRDGGKDVAVSSVGNRQLTVSMKVNGQQQWDHLYTKIRGMPEVAGYSVIYNVCVDAQAKVAPITVRANSPMMGIIRSAGGSPAESVAVQKAIEDLCRGKADDLSVRTTGHNQMAVTMKVRNQGDWDQLYAKIKGMPEVAGYAVIYNVSVK